MSQGCTVSVEEIQSWWEVPAIAHFCSLFRTAFNLPDFEIEELEKALSEQDLDFLGDLVACLLQGCYQRTDITPQAFSSYLDDIISYRWELEEGKPNPLREGPFESLPPRTQVELLHRLCDYRLDAADVFDLLKGLDADSLRVEPLGQDGNGALYWYFYGTRMYKEEPVTKKVGKHSYCPSLLLSMTFFVGTSWLYISYSEVESDVPEVKTDHELEDLPPTTGRKRGAWSLVCDTEEQWLSLAESIKDKTSPQDRHLYRVISQNFLPEISNMIEHKEREQKQKLLDPNPVRVSQRFSQNHIKHEERDNLKAGMEEEEEKKKDEELDRQVLLAEQRREEERLLQEERQREKLEKIKAVEGKMPLSPLSGAIHPTEYSPQGIGGEYTIMAESLERCFSRALLKHFPSEDGDTDEEFHVSREDKERKERKRSRNSKAFGPESLIRATEQAQRKRSSQKGKSSATSEEDARLARLHPHWANGPPHPHSLPPSQQHIREGDMRGLYHPGQQLRQPGPPGPHGPHMYAQRMAMDPRFAYQVHFSRQGDPNLNQLPHNFNIQQRMIEPHHMGPRYPVGPDPNQQQHSYMGPTHGPCLGPRPMTLQPGAPPEASIYPSHHRPEGHTVHPMGNRFSGPEVSPQHNYPGLRPAGMPLPTMWSGMNQQGQERPSGMSIQDPNMVNQRNFSYGGIPPPVGHKPWPEAAGYPNHPSNAQFQMTAAASSPGLMSARPTAPHSDSSGRTRLASMLESPEMLALQQLSASSGPPAGAPHQHTGNFQQPGPPSRIGSIPAHPSQQLPPAPEVQLLHPARDKGPDRQPPQQTNLHPKGRADLLLLEPTRLDTRSTAMSPQHTRMTSSVYKHPAFSPNRHQTQLVGSNVGIQAPSGPSDGHNPAVPPHSQGPENSTMSTYGMGNPPLPHYNRANMNRSIPPSAHHPYHNQSINALHNLAPNTNYQQQQGGSTYPYHVPGQPHPHGHSNVYPPHQYQQQQRYYAQPHPQTQAHNQATGRGGYPPEEWHRPHYQSHQAMPHNAYLPVASARANGQLKESSVSPLGSEGSSGTSLVSPGPMPETGTHPGGTEEGKCENQQAGGGSSINGSPAKRPHNDASEQPESPKEILDLDSHNAAAQRRSMQHPHASVAHMTSGFVYDPRALHPGMQQGVVHHMMSQARGAGNGSPYAGQPYPDPRHYAAQRPHSHLMEALQRPQQLPYSPGQTRMVMYRHPRPGGHFQGMMIQQRGVGPERFIHPGQQMMAAPSGLGSKQGL
ncbi:cat eye syndrome critical region protein 2 homolog [Neolamprologus brichardi]|uniref:cat eye syndrome critical region protein 2 homolog n=1 Tax=Neolamprologus brichardi TaxID=32507 RepID=UPI001643C1A8|nr:cat eye syndrome critical region protein 2 homolog [Neolamprologus brichardi]